ncbi:hypothetical protein pb186bvf_005939 [Paramecium bursaria]
MILCQIFYISKWIQQFKTKIVKINMITQILGFIYNRLMNNNSIIQLRPSKQLNGRVAHLEG